MSSRAMVLTQNTNLTKIIRARIAIDEKIEY